MGKKPLYFRQINRIEVLVYQSVTNPWLEVKFRKRSSDGRMVSTFQPCDMDVVSYLACDVRNMFVGAEIVTTLESSSEPDA